MKRWIAALILAWLITYSASGLAALPDPLPASEREARLRARVEGYWQAMQQGAWSKTAEFVKPSERDFFLGVNKTAILSYAIDKILLEADGTRAQVNVTVKKPFLRSMQRVDLKVHNVWEWVDGEWFVVFKRHGRERFGGSSPGGAVSNPTSLQISPDPAASSDDDRRVINIDDHGELPLEATYNFGQTFSGERIHFKFTFKNIGTKPLRIKMVQTADSSLSAVLVDPDGKETAQRQFDPKQMGEVNVTLDSRGLSDRVQRHATLLFEGRKAPLVLRMKGFVNKNFALTPALVVLDPARPVGAEVTVVNETGQFVTLHGIEQVPAFLGAVLSKGELAPHDLATVNVSIKPGSKIPPVGYEGTLWLLTNLKRQPTIPIPIRVPR